jgi:hypothetical protein
MEIEDRHVGGDCLVHASSMEHKGDRGAVRGGETVEGFVLALRTPATGKAERAEKKDRMRPASVAR